MRVKALSLPAFESLRIPPGLLRDLRSNHAGETGAVYIYRGMLHNTRDRELVAFAHAHLSTEFGHLELLERWLPRSCRSVLLPLWRVSGWLLGALAARMGREFAFVTIAAVEHFVVAHYQSQINRADGALRELLVCLQSDEAEHRDEAEMRLSSASGWHRLWAKVVYAGSAAAVWVARAV